MSWLIAILVVFGSLLMLGGGVSLARRRRRVQASTFPADETPALRVDSQTARVFVSRDLLAGPSAGGINHSKANLVLTPKRLLVATHQGRVLELTPQAPGSVRCTGPGRLVVEGARGEVRVRVEVLMEGPEAWVDQAAALLGSSKSALAS